MSKKDNELRVMDEHIAGSVEYEYGTDEYGEKLEITVWFATNLRSGGVLKDMLTKNYGVALVQPKNEHCLQIGLLDMTHQEIHEASEKRRNSSFWGKLTNLFV